MVGTLKQFDEEGVPILTVNEFEVIPKLIDALILSFT